MSNLITPKDKIAAVFEAYPELRDELIQRSPRYENLDNQAVFNIVGKVATIEVVAKVAGDDLDELLTFLNTAIGQPEVNLAAESGRERIS
jgi:NitT/TauT family transport system substrate-binding protein